MQWIDVHDIRGWLLHALALGVGGGILFRSFLTFTDHVITTLVVLLALLCVLIGICTPQSGRRVFAMLGIFLFAWCIGVFRMEHGQNYFDQILLDLAPHSGGSVKVEGRVISDSETRGLAEVFVVRAESVAGEHADAQIEVRSSTPVSVTYGDRVIVEAALSLPEAFETEYGRTFPYGEFMRARGISAVMPYADVVVSEKGSIWNIRAALFLVKHKFMESIALLLPGETAGLANGLLLGVKNALPEDTEDTFRTVGIIHIIVLSGYNLTIVAEFVMRLLSHFLAPRPRLIIGGVTIMLFALMVGFSATVARATVMALLVLVARATGNVYGALRGLMFAGLVMLLWNPYVLAFDPGFQLSFLATFGLIVLGPLVEKKLGWMPSRLGLREFASATLATQIFVAPYLAYAMGTVSTVFLCTNLLVLTVVPITMLLTALSGICGMIMGIIAVPVAYVPYLLLSYIIWVAELFSKVPYASISIPLFPVWGVSVAYALIGLALFYIYTKTRAHQMMRAGEVATS